MKRLFGLTVLFVTGFLAFGPAQSADVPAEVKAVYYKNIVDTQEMAKLAVVPVRDDVLVIDSRPARKYEEGHIPGAVNISDSQFDKNAGLLPADKKTTLIFYCGGLACPLSHKSAAKAEALGYGDVKVFAEGYPGWIKAGHLGSYGPKQVKKLLDAGKITLIDARPGRKFKEGNVPGSINISDSRFDKEADKLPADKAAELVFYCGGVKCPLSPKSADKAKAMGYTNVMLFQGGYPVWVEAFGKAEQVTDAPAATAPAANADVKIETGDSPDSITVESFKAILANKPDMIQIIDVRDPHEFEAGSFKGAINIPIDTIEDKIDDLPTGKPIVFVCATGARSGEAFDIVKMENESLPVYFLDAQVSYKGGDAFEIQ